MGIDKIGPYGMTEEEKMQDHLIAAGMRNNPYPKDSEEADTWREGYFAAWKVLGDRFAELCAERP